jgi:hypothetical protein
MPAETFGGCKLPHHKPGKSGTGVAVWNGVKAAMGALMGARGGVDMPDADRKGVYNHLAKHYEEFGKEPPDFKLVELANHVSLLSSAEGIKIGRVLSQTNYDKLRSAIESLNEILQAAEPQQESEIAEAVSTPEKSALTARKMALQLEVKRRALASMALNQ